MLRGGFITLNIEDNKAFEDILEKQGLYMKIASLFYGIYDIKYEKLKLIE